MKKILVIVYTPTYGGPHNQIVQLYDALLEQGWETIALLPEADPESYKRLKERGIKVITRPLKRLRAKNIISNNLNYITSFRKNVNHIKEVIIREKVDVVQMCGLMHVHAAFACRALNVPLVWQFLGTFAPLPLRIIYTPFATYYADWIMTTGMKTAKQHIFHKFFRNKHTVFYPPVKTNRFRFTPSKRKKAREWMGVSEDAFLIGTVGNLNKTKGHDRIVEIANHFKNEKNVAFRIVGKHTPSHAEYYRKEVVEKAKKKQLLSTGKLSILEDDISIDTVMSGFDIFLLTSRIEGMPTVVLEAMSTGLPIVTNDIGSVKEVVTNNINGYVYSDLLEACNIISNLRNDSGNRCKIAETNRAEAKNKYDVKACSEKHLEVYNKVIKNSS